jgi:predicted nucleic acid-binding protein
VDASLARLSADLAAQLQLGGADALYVALAQRLGIPLITWDREQLQRGLAAVTALTPDDALE